MDNIVAAFNSIRDDLLAGGTRDLSAEMICDFNRQVLEGLELEDGVVPGEFRTHSVVVSRYRGAPAEDLDFLIGRMCEWLNGPDFFRAADDPWHLPFAILKAIAAHLYLAWIHPFGDGNGRTARLIELQILLAAGVPTPATHLLSNHYNQTRAEYQRCLDEASRRQDGQMRLIMYAVQGFVDGLRDQLAMIRDQQFDDRWEQYIYEQFGESTSASHMRRRQLVLDITKAKRPIVRSEMRELSSSLAVSYAQKTSKTLTRDLNAIREMNLLRTVVFRDDRQRRRIGYVARRELIEAFLPLSAPDEPDRDLEEPPPQG